MAQVSPFVHGSLSCVMSVIGHLLTEQYMTRKNQLNSVEMKPGAWNYAHLIGRQVMGTLVITKLVELLDIIMALKDFFSLCTITFDGVYMHYYSPASCFHNKQSGISLFLKKLDNVKTPKFSRMRNTTINYAANGFTSSYMQITTTPWWLVLE